jgi:nitrilase
VSASRTVRVGAAHAAPLLLDVDATIDKACELIARAGREGVELLVFPEVFVPGFPYFINLYAPDAQFELLARYAEASIAVPGPEVARVQQAARAAGVHVVLGVSERDGGSSFNTQVFIDGEGRYLGKHRKLQPTHAERFVWMQGDGSTLQTFDTAVGRVGGLICWEHTMNLARHALALKGEQIHASSWPGLEAAKNLSGLFDMQVEALSRAQALSNQCFIVVAGSPVTRQMLDVMEAAAGPQPHLGTGGGYSAVIAPLGTHVVEPLSGPDEGLLVAGIDLAEIDALKLLVDAGGHFSRREVLRMTLDEQPYAALERLDPQPPAAPQEPPR